MATTAAVTISRCPKCGATHLYTNDDGDPQCLICAFIIWPEPLSVPSAMEAWGEKKALRGQQPRLPKYDRYRDGVSLGPKRETPLVRGGTGIMAPMKSYYSP